MANIPDRIIEINTPIDVEIRRLIQVNPLVHRAFMTCRDSELEALRFAVVMLARAGEHHRNLLLRASELLGTDWLNKD